MKAKINSIHNNWIAKHSVSKYNLLELHLDFSLFDNYIIFMHWCQHLNLFKLWMELWFPLAIFCCFFFSAVNVHLKINLNPRERQKTLEIIIFLFVFVFDFMLFIFWQDFISINIGLVFLFSFEFKSWVLYFILFFFIFCVVFANPLESVSADLIGPHCLIDFFDYF